MYKLRSTDKYDKNNKEVKHRLQRLRIIISEMQSIGIETLIATIQI